MNNIKLEFDIDTYKSMGFLDGILPEDYKDVAVLYNYLFCLTSSKFFDEYVKNISLEEWWNSFIPEKYMDEASFDEDLGVDIIFSVLHKLLVNYEGKFDFFEFLTALNKCTLSPFMNKEPLNEDEYPSFKKLYDKSSKLIAEMCKLYFILNEGKNN